MPASDQDAFDEDDGAPTQGARRRLFKGNPEKEPKDDSDKGSIVARLSNAMLKPATGNEKRPSDSDPTTVEELETAVKTTDDRERLIGLFAAPIAGVVTLIVVGSLIGNDPKALLANGQINTAHVNPSLYIELGAVALALSVAMLALAWFRKRLYLGIVMALYGLSIFNLHFWGFGVPYILAGAWYLVHAYRLQQKLKLAKAADGPSGSGRPQVNKRYTPPSRRPSKPKPGKEPEAG